MIVNHQQIVEEERIVATGVSEDEYMEKYAADFCEWVDGVVIKMSPVTSDHDDLTTYLRGLLNAYFALRPIGFTKGAPFVMRAVEGKSRREPDIQVILNENRLKFTETAMLGPADICIEVASTGTRATDEVTKFNEYEQGGVKEYWTFDRHRREARFYRLNEDGVYLAYREDEGGNYATPLLPGFKLHVPTLWQSTLPNIVETVTLVQEMLK